MNEKRWRILMVVFLSMALCLALIAAVLTAYAYGWYVHLILGAGGVFIILFVVSLLEYLGADD